MRTQAGFTCIRRRTSRIESGFWFHGLVVAFLLGSAVAAAGDTGFRVRLGLVHGHLRECWFGCEKGATDGYDRRLDEMAPPPGIQTGYTAFVSPDKKFWLYKDIRGFADTVVWRFGAQVYGKKTIEISWKPKDLPALYDFSIQLADKKLDMRKVKNISVPESGVLTLRAVRRKPEPKPEMKK